MPSDPIAPPRWRTHALEAVETARRFGDRDLEAAALVRLGYAEVATGDVVSGMAKVDEALTAATGGEVSSLEVIGDVICVGIAACELAADWQRIEQWGQAVEGWITSHNHVAVLGFCYACCAEMFIASGNWEMADGMLAEGLQAMQAANLRARCVHPAAKLAELRITQGRHRGGRAAPRRVRGAPGVDPRAGLALPRAGRDRDGRGRPAPPAERDRRRERARPPPSSTCRSMSGSPRATGRVPTPRPRSSQRSPPVRRSRGSRRWRASREGG